MDRSSPSQISQDWHRDAAHNRGSEQPRHACSACKCPHMMGKARKKIHNNDRPNARSAAKRCQETQRTKHKTCRACTQRTATISEKMQVGYLGDAQSFAKRCFPSICCAFLFRQGISCDLSALIYDCLAEFCMQCLMRAEKVPALVALVRFSCSWSVSRCVTAYRS